MMLFSMLLAGVAAPNKCNSEQLHMKVKPHMHQRAARNLGQDAASLGPEMKLWVMGQVAR